jgi:hypothetical protein
MLSEATNELPEEVSLALAAANATRMEGHHIDHLNDGERRLCHNDIDQMVKIIGVCTPDELDREVE